MNSESLDGHSSAALPSLPSSDAVEVQEVYPGRGNSVWVKLRGNPQSVTSCVNNIGAPPPRPSGSFGYDPSSPFDPFQTFSDPMLGQFSPPSSQTPFPSSQSGDQYVNAMQVFQRPDEQAPVGMSFSFLDNPSTFDFIGLNDGFPFSQGSSTSAPAAGFEQEFFVQFNGASGSGMASVQASDSQESTVDGGSDAPGPYGFSISFPKKANGKDWVFNEDNKKLYAIPEHQWDIQFDFTKAPPTEFTIKAHAEFQDKGNYGNMVQPCIKHKDVVKLWAKHDNDSVILTFSGKSSDKKYAVKGKFQCTCHNSCYKAKCTIHIVFEFRIKNKVMGRKSLEIRSCACPIRDSGADSKKTLEPGRKRGRGQKRKAGEMSPEENKSPEMVIKEEEENSLINGGDTNVFMTTGQPRPSKTLNLNAMEHKLEMDEQSIYLDFSVRLPVQFKNIVDGQLKSLFSVVEMVKTVFPFAGTRVPLEAILNAETGLRPAAVAVPTKVPSRENVGEISSWLRTVVKNHMIPYQAFVHEGSGIETLDDIFRLTRTELANYLSAFRDEVIEIVWQHIQTKERPVGPFAPASQSVPQSYSFSQS